MKYYQVFISAESTDQAQVILDVLLRKKLITGGPILKGPATFWWKGSIESMDYVYIFSYTIGTNKGQIISETKKVSEEEIPMISFISFEGNQELLRYISDTLAKVK